MERNNNLKDPVKIFKDPAGFLWNLSRSSRIFQGSFVIHVLVDLDKILAYLYRILEDIVRFLKNPCRILHDLQGSCLVPQAFVQDLTISLRIT